MTPEVRRTSPFDGGAPAVGPRERCLWLGALASWRSGLAQRLLREFTSYDAVLSASAVDLIDCLTPAGSHGDRPADTHDDLPRYQQLLELGPAATAGRLDAFPAGLVVAWCDPLYPPALRQLPDPPFCLFVRAAGGRPAAGRRLQQLGSLPAAAVVGSRRPSPYGTEMAALLGHDLAAVGVVVVSGMAMGIDAVAQEAALHVRRDHLVTVGVLGCGADGVYPRVNEPLFRRVAARGLLLSEFSWGVPARPWRFPARNRVMVGLSRAVVVVEGGQRSGARVTATHANDLGREVLAVPGEAGRLLTAAPHALLRDGARLCESADDVMAAIAATPLPDHGDVDGGLGGTLLARLFGPDGRPTPAGMVAQELARGEADADQVARGCGIGASEAAALLSELEVDGFAELARGGRYRLRLLAARELVTASRRH